MNAPSHLTDEQIARYRGRTLDPADLLDADDHLAGCDACRERLARGRSLRGDAAQLMARVTDHLDYDAVVACAEGRGTDEQRRHAAGCELCAAELADLRRFQGELRRTPVEIPRPRFSRKWIGLAAGLALFGELGFWTWLNHRTKPAPSTTVAVSASVPPFERAAVLDRLISKPGALLGASTGAPEFELIGPMGTAVVTDRPVFRWRPFSEGARYVVAVFDENFQKVAESPEVTGAAWQPDRPLPRGVVLNWQVTAESGSKRVHAPMPPAPEARLEVVPAVEAAAIEAARTANPADHLRIAALLAKAGALDEAEAELAQVDAKTAAPYREQLREMR